MMFPHQSESPNAIIELTPNENQMLLQFIQRNDLSSADIRRMYYLSCRANANEQMTVIKKLIEYAFTSSDSSQSSEASRIIQNLLPNDDFFSQLCFDNCGADLLNQFLDQLSVPDKSQIANSFFTIFASFCNPEVLLPELLEKICAVVSQQPQNYNILFTIIEKIETIPAPIHALMLQIISSKLHSSPTNFDFTSALTFYYLSCSYGIPIDPDFLNSILSTIDINNMSLEFSKLLFQAIVFHDHFPMELFQGAIDVLVKSIDIEQITIYARTLGKFPLQFPPQESYLIINALYKRITGFDVPILLNQSQECKPSKISAHNKAYLYATVLIMMSTHPPEDEVKWLAILMEILELDEPNLAVSTLANTAIIIANCQQSNAIKLISILSEYREVLEGYYSSESEEVSQLSSRLLNILDQIEQ